MIGTEVILAAPPCRSDARRGSTKRMRLRERLSVSSRNRYPGGSPEGYRFGLHNLRHSLISSSKRNGRHDETRTPDLYGVNFEVTPLKSFSSLAFPIYHTCRNARKELGFGDELVTSFSDLYRKGTSSACRAKFTDRPPRRSWNRDEEHGAQSRAKQAITQIEIKFELLSLRLGVQNGRPWGFGQKTWIPCRVRSRQ